MTLPVYVRAQLSQPIIYRRTTRNKQKERLKMQTVEGLSRISPVQYSPRRQYGWVTLADNGGKD